MSVVVIIPARFGSTRLPGKALADLSGKPMIVHVLRRAQLAAGVDRVLVATDDDRIATAVEAEGGEVVMTRADHPSGTDRIAEVARGLTADVIVNVQGDLPLLEPGYVEAAVRALGPTTPTQDSPVASGAPETSGGGAASLPVMSTLATPLRDDELHRSQVVKVVCDRQGDALYFSRSPLPWPGEPSASGAVLGAPTGALRHVGLYAYRRSFLLDLAALTPTPLERQERLEQLRVLEHGYRIRVAVVEASDSMVEVDTPEDLERARRLVPAWPGREVSRGERAGVARSTRAAVGQAGPVGPLGQGGSDRSAARADVAASRPATKAAARGRNG